MTNFKVENFPFAVDAVSTWAVTHPKHRNWPIVYVLNNAKDVYVGESLNAQSRMTQHLASGKKSHLQRVRVVLDDTFNKSVCLDLESFLIRMFSGDGEFRVLNQNAGITDADYYQRADYQTTFTEIFETLRENEHLFTRSIPEIENQDLFKLSPFKALNHDQAIAVEDILEGLFEDLESGRSRTIVVQGNPGTGKTIVAIFLLKLLEDIRLHDPDDLVDNDSIFSEFFEAGHAKLLTDFKIGFVIPQQSLRESVKKVFALTPGLSKSMVLTPFEVGSSSERYDLLIVDEAHRLNQRANQSSGPQNKKFSEINVQLYGTDDLDKTQLDWVRDQSTYCILMLDAGQSVRPADLSSATTRELVAQAEANDAHYLLQSQMRLKVADHYIDYVRAALSNDRPPKPESFDGYDLQFFDDFEKMRREIEARDREVGLARIVAGYAWPWLSRNDAAAFDIELDGQQMRWNSTDKDWINSRNALEEVGSIHTVQGYDLNYAGVIIGRDIRLDPTSGLMHFDRNHYADAKGKENNRKRGITYTDDDIFEFVRNIYTVLLTRGMLGTYVYVCDEPLREELRKYFA